MIYENKKCRKCEHFETHYDPAFVINEAHYYCNAVTYLETDEFGQENYVPVCIDGFYWRTGDCKCFKCKNDKEV